MGKKWYKWLIWGLAAAIIKVFSLNRQMVEEYYSTGLYPYLSRGLRFLLGWLPFSLGDIAYGLAVCWLLRKLYLLAKMLLQRRITRAYLWQGVQKTLFFGLVVYVVFNLMWGLNYNRTGIAQQLGLAGTKYDTADVRHINAVLLRQVNTCRRALGPGPVQWPGNRQLFAGVQQAYRAAQQRYPFLHYQFQSLKPSLWGWLGNYTGFTGYYNPFSGEAHVNTTVPRFLLPYTSCHEAGHQLGYAKENEANFAGFLAARSSPDTMFKYSLYLDLFLYANRNLSWTDTAAAGMYRAQLDTAVRADLEEWRLFNRRHRNPVEPVIRYLYGLYLRSNEQPHGIFSYDAVTAFIIAYYKKFGEV